VAGFCWGGAQTFRFATNRANLAAAFVFYGTGPEKDAMARIKAPVYGFYGGADARVNATIPASEELMKAAGKAYEPVIYDGAGHGFMRAGEEPDTSAENKKAREEAWKRWKSLLAKIGESVSGRTIKIAFQGPIDLLDDFEKVCAATFQLTDDAKRADFRLQIQGGTTTHTVYDVAVFDAEGKLLYTGKTRLGKNAVKDACKAIEASQKQSQ